MRFITRGRLYALLFFLIPISAVDRQVYAQTPIGAPEIFLPTPQSMIFNKAYVDHPVDECYGLPEISIPLGEIETKGLKIPITLSYHASGVKYMQYDGETGAGWTINVGGYRISRQVIGRCDFQFNKSPYSVKDPVFDWNDEPGRDRALANMCALMTNSGDLYHLDASAYNDQGRDIFTHHTPTTSGHFVLTGPIGHGMMLDNSHTTVKGSLDEMQMHDTEGNYYVFGGMQDGEKLIENSNPVVPGNSHVVGWPLREVTDIYGQKVKFRYVRYNVSKEMNRSATSSYIVTDAETGGYLTPVDEFASRDHTNPSLTIIKPTAPTYYSYMIDEIETALVRVKFHRKDMTDGTNSPCLIETIEISSKDGKVSKKIKLDYSILGTHEKGLPWHYVLKGVQFIKKLNGLDEVEKSYKLGYIEPPVNFYAYPDQWGYYKKKYDNSGEVFLPDQLKNDEFLASSASGYMFPNYICKPISQQTAKGVVFAEMNKATDASLYFSLNKIVYPTGGITEFEYEPHSYKGLTGGGLRVKKITVSESESVKKIETAYKYEEGIPNFDLDPKQFKTLSYSLLFKDYASPAGISFYNIYLAVKKVRTYSSVPTGDIPIADFKVGYKKVTTEKYGSVNSIVKPQGTIVSEFHIPKVYNTGPIIGSSSCPPILRIGDPLPGGGYTQANAGQTTISYKKGFKPILKKRRVFNTDGKLVQQTVHDYIVSDTINNKYYGLKVEKKLIFNNHDTDLKYYGRHADQARWSLPYIFLGYSSEKELNLEKFAYIYVNTFFAYTNYDVIIGTNFISKITDTLYAPDGGETTTVTKYEYDDQWRNTAVSTSTSKGSFQTERYDYPQLYSYLWDQNLKLNKLAVNTTVGEKEVSSIKYLYEDYMKFPSSIQRAATSAGPYRDEVTFDQYDQSGNLQQYTMLDNMPVTVLWSYGDTYPVVEVKNATLDQVDSALGWIKIRDLREQLTVTDEELSAIRAVIQQKVPSALITTYTYQPLNGITSVCDPRGVYTLYDYDNFGRLYEVSLRKDDTSLPEVRERYEYNYQK